MVYLSFTYLHAHTTVVISIVWHGFSNFCVFVVGKEWQEKVYEALAAIEKSNAKSLVVSALDEICWLFNLRGSDVPYTPLFKAYALIQDDNIRLICSFLCVSHLSLRRRCMSFWFWDAWNFSIYKLCELPNFAPIHLKSFLSWCVKLSSFNCLSLILLMLCLNGCTLYSLPSIIELHFWLDTSLFCLLFI